MIESNIVQQNAALLWLLHSRQQVQQGAFPRTIPPEHRHALPGANAQFADVQHGELLFFVVIKPDVVQLIITAQVGFMHFFAVLGIVNRTLHQVIQSLAGHLC